MEKIAKIINTIRPEEDFNQSENFIEDGLLDSFDIVLFVAELEKSFSISIDGIDIIPENLKSFQSIHNLLKKYGVEI